jgi:hypothetical protein
MSLSTPIFTTSSEICACAAFHANADAPRARRAVIERFTDFLPSYLPSFALADHVYRARISVKHSRRDKPLRIKQGIRFAVIGQAVDVPVADQRRVGCGDRRAAADDDNAIRVSGDPAA